MGIYQPDPNEVSKLIETEQIYQGLDFIFNAINQGAPRTEEVFLPTDTDLASEKFLQSIYSAPEYVNASPTTKNSITKALADIGLALNLDDEPIKEAPAHDPIEKMRRVDSERLGIKILISSAERSTSSDFSGYDAEKIELSLLESERLGENGKNKLHESLYELGQAVTSE